ncbi:ATP-binding cassette domain-containing protein [Ideonella sp.]|uniref:ATP-binding cassette domain-containing protein n=1 Tax=Ideonella sp. TaxID=1929293 RepID=UPI0035B44D29
MKEVVAGLWAAVWQYRWRTLAALGLLVAAKIVAVGVPLIFKAIIDTFSQREAAIAAGASDPRQLVVALPVFLLLGYALLRFTGTLFTELRDLMFARVTMRTVGAFAQRTFAHLLALSPRFHAARNTGSLIRDVERGTGGVGFLLGAGLFTVLPTLVEFVFVLAVLIAAGYSVWFTVTIGVTFFVYATYTTLLTRRREQRQREVNEIDSLASGRMVDGLLNVEMVKTYARRDFELHRYQEVQQRWIDAGVRNQKALSVLHIGQSAIIAAGVATVMLLAGQQTLAGTLSVGDLVLVNSYVIQICMPLNTLGFVFRETIDALVNTEKLFALLKQAPEISDAPGAQPLALQGGEVVFDHVHFAYEAGRPILSDFNLHLPPGKTVAVVGGSGSGKSTLARLLLRLYDPQGGRVLIDGQDLRSLQQDSVYHAIGVVSQDTALFNDTIAFNIGYGRMGVGLAEVIEAAKAAQVHEFIVSLPQQYDTIVGERGMKLSGGEKQRIAIARALLKNPPLMIFDEATSALDTRAERAIQRELDRIAQGRTTLIIAHRLSTIVNADQIVVMDRGRIVESGRHQELLERDGLYAQLWNLQLQQREFERLERRMARQPVNLAVLLAGTVDALRALTEPRGIALYTDVDLVNASVSGDPGMLAQALYAIGRQAVRATPAGGRIEIRLVRHDVNARVSITDGRQGRALPAEGTLPELDPDIPPLDPLTLRSTLERMGGRFETDMATAVHGMRFHLELPLLPLVVAARPAPGHAAEATAFVAASQAAHRAAPAGDAAAGADPAGVDVAEPGPPVAPVPPVAPPLPPMPLAGLAVMCVDDDRDALSALTEVLQEEGAAVLAFSSGRDAIGWLNQHGTAQWPQLLACDISLGGGEDGHAVVRRIRQIEAERGVPLAERLPALALTGLARPEHRLMALMAGFQVHLAKPVDPPELIATLVHLAGRGLGSAASAAA